MSQSLEGNGISRRRLLTGAVAAGSAAIAGLGSLEYFGKLNKGTLRELFDSGRLHEEIDELRRKLAERYSPPGKRQAFVCGASITLANKDVAAARGIRYVESTSAYAELQFLLIVRQALAQYPPELVQRYINSVHVVADLEVRDGELHGVYLVNGGILLNDNPLRSEAKGRGVSTNTIHHEIAHALTLLLVKESDAFAKEWEQQTGSVYVGDEWVRQDREPAGFVEPLGTKNPLEDMATVAEALFSNNEELFRRATHDKGLRTKINLILGWYKGISHGRMDESYWDWRSKLGDVGETYWDKHTTR